MYERMMKELNSATKLLQAPNMFLADCRDILDALIEAVREEQGDTSSALYRCKLGTRYIGEDSTIIQDQRIENVVVKVQRNPIQLLSPAENRAIRHLKSLPTSTSSPSITVLTSLRERVVKKRKSVGISSKYISIATSFLGLQPK